MTKPLPPRPDLAWLKKAAKERLAALRAAEPAARLHEAQHAIAGEYGFPSWRALKAHVDRASLDGAIIAAALSGDARQLDAHLAEHPAKLRITGGPWNRPLLHLAAGEGRLAAVELLLRRGLSVHERDRLDNATALHWAAQGGHIPVAERLLAEGADIDGAGDAHEIGVIGWATCFDALRETMADFLLARGAQPNIFAVVALGRGDLVRQLVAADSSALTRRMSRFEHQRSALHLAVLRNRLEMVRLLIELGADPLAKDSRGVTPLNEVSQRTDPAVADLLIAAGADPAERGANRFSESVPIFNVRNVPASIDYYVGKLGFRKAWDWGSPPTFAEMQRDAVRIFLCEGAQGAPGMWVSIFVQDVDALHADYARRGAIIRQAPTNFPWGLREMNVQDLDGHRLRLGSPATGPSDEVGLEERA